MSEYNCHINPETGRGWRWQPGKKLIINHYEHVFMPNHPAANTTGHVRVHRLLIEEKIGRYLTPDEEVHHKDHDTLNNDIDNLVLLTKAEHSRLHKEEWSKGWWKTANKLKNRPKNPNMARKKKKTIIITTKRNGR